MNNYMAETITEIERLAGLAREIRRDILEMIYRTKSPHIGSSFSMVELLIVLYFKILSIEPGKSTHPNRDRFLLSKGHGCPALYAVLAKRGFLSKEELNKFAVDGSILGQHPNRNLKQGIEITAGSLGHGLSQANGMALAAKYDQAKYRIFVFLGDGELNEGSVWEAALFASHHQLDNLIAIIDRNRLQALGKESEILNLEPLAEKWRSFNWAVKEIDGHNFAEIIAAFSKIPLEKGKPTCIIAQTIKGKGVSFMENNPLWHDKYPDEAEYQKAKQELS
jgi:transketolase